MKVVTILWNNSGFTVEFWHGDRLDRVKKYQGMTAAFRFDICNWLGA